MNRTLPLFAAVASAVALSTAVAAPARAGDPPPPIRLKLSDEVVAPGQRVRISVKVASDGFLLVLRADAHGRVRVLFPLDPSDTGVVRAGKEYDIRGRGERDGFMVDDRDGSGIVLAAVSKTPFTFQEFTRGVHWDYRALAARDSSADPEAALLDVVDRMAAGDYDYDQASYTVSGRAYDRRNAVWHPGGMWGGGWGRGWPGGWWWPYDRWGWTSYYGPRFVFGTTFVVGRSRFVGRRWR